jgi:hypothetical protein
VSSGFDEDRPYTYLAFACAVASDRSFSVTSWTHYSLSAALEVLYILDQSLQKKVLRRQFVSSSVPPRSCDPDLVGTGHSIDFLVEQWGKTGVEWLDLISPYEVWMGREMVQFCASFGFLVSDSPCSLMFPDSLEGTCRAMQLMDNRCSE